jgi:hypothetical protein
VEAKKNPDTQFYFFVPPYSTLWWDKEMQEGNLERQITALELASELLVEVENIKLFSFAELYETAADLNNYTDILHYSSEINTYILKAMRNGECLLTADNYHEHWKNVRDYYLAFDYDEYFRIQERDLIRRNAEVPSDNP